MQQHMHMLQTLVQQALAPAGGSGGVRECFSYLIAVIEANAEKILDLEAAMATRSQSHDACEPSAVPSKPELKCENSDGTSTLDSLAARSRRSGSSASTYSFDEGEVVDKPKRTKKFKKPKAIVDTLLSLVAAKPEAELVAVSDALSAHESLCAEAFQNLQVTSETSTAAV
jgi:hypothetical protein